MEDSKDIAVLSLSGGMDSSALLLKLLVEGYEVTTLTFDYGQKHDLELQMAKALRQYLFENDYTVNAFDINLTDLTPLLKSNLIIGGEEIPEGHYENKNMVLTVVPNRNKIFSSILQSVALSKVNGSNEVVIAMGIHAGDHAIYPDCRQEFRDADYNAFVLGNYNADQVTYYTPFLESDKYLILEEAVMNCDILNLDFDEVFKRTNTSYKPIGCYADYKSASSVERIEAFMKLGRPDPVQYADFDNGVVVKRSWETVSHHVGKILSASMR